MRAPSFAVIAAVLIGISLVVLVAVGGRERATPVAAAPAAAAATSVSGGGITLSSVSADLPADEAVFPAGPNVDLVNQRCLSCHSASMVLTQPPLKAEQWQAIVEKMRDTYHAPVAPGEVAPIVAYLARRDGSAGDVGTFVLVGGSCGLRTGGFRETANDSCRPENDRVSGKDAAPEGCLEAC